MRVKALLDAAPKILERDLWPFVLAWSGISNSPGEIYRILREHGLNYSRTSVYRALKRIQEIAGKIGGEEGEF